MVIAVLVVLLLILAVLHSLVRHNYSQFAGLSSLKSIISQNVLSSSVQNAAITLINYTRQSKPLPPDELLAIYNDRYDEHCLTSVDVMETLCELYPHRDDIVSYL